MSIHADKDWIKARAELSLSVLDDAAHACISLDVFSSGIAEAVVTLYSNPQYMTEYADALDRFLHGEPIPEQPIQR
jgi:hypothetical protein